MPPLRHAALLATGLASLLVAAPAASAHTANNGRSAVEGTLRAWHGDTFSTPVDVGVGIDTTLEGIVNVTGAPKDNGRLLGRRVRGEGARSGQTLALDGGLTATGSSALAAVTGSKSVAVLLFNFSNNAAQPWTATAVRNVVFDGATSVAAYYADASYGALSLSGDVYGWYSIDSPDTGCAYTTWASEARAKAQAAGVSLGSYQYVVYAFPRTTSCGWAGLAYLPGTGSWINGAMTLRVVGHELGHNLGVHHASTLRCSDGGSPSVVTGSCSADEYGDPFTIMGSASTRLHHNWHRAQLGWAVGTQTVTTTGIYNLPPAELASGAPRLLRVPRNDGTYLNLEFRQPSGNFDTFPATDAAVTGVSVRIAPDAGTIVQSRLVDATPGTSSFADAPFLAGSSFTDPLSRATVTVVSVSPAGASVSITFEPDTAPPSTPTSLSATTLSSSSIRLAWGAATDNVGVTGYQIRRDGVIVATTSATTWTDTALAPATSYSYAVVALDGAGNASAAATVSGTTSTPDAAAPSQPGTLTARVAKGRKVNLAWGAATDNVGVAGYRVFRNGVQVASVSTLTYRDAPGRGTFTYAVRAFDAAGNVGPATAAVSVTT